LKSTSSRCLTRSITSPTAPHLRQLKTLFLVFTLNRSVPPHMGHGPSRSCPRPLSLYPRRIISSSIGTERACAIHALNAGVIGLFQEITMKPADPRVTRVVALPYQPREILFPAARLLASQDHIARRHRWSRAQQIDAPERRLAQPSCSVEPAHHPDQ